MFQITLAAARINAGIGASEAANLRGIGRTTLWQYENGKREPRRDIIRRMAELYKIPIERLNY